MNRKFIVSCVMALVFAYSSFGYCEQQVCSQADVARAIKKLNAGEKIAENGLQMWMSDLDKLASDSKGASFVAAGSGAMAAVASGILAGAGWVALDAYVMKILVSGAAEKAFYFVVPSAIGTIQAFAWVDSVNAKNNFIKAPDKNVADSFKVFDKAHQEALAARQKKTTSRWEDFKSFGNATAESLKALYEEAVLHAALFERELKYIQDVRPVLQNIQETGVCGNLSAVETKRVKALREAPVLLDEINRGSVVAPAAR